MGECEALCDIDCKILIRLFHLLLDLAWHSWTYILSHPPDTHTAVYVYNTTVWHFSIGMYVHLKVPPSL